MEIKKYSTFQKEAAEDLRLTHNSSQLPTIFKNESYNETGVAVTGYGKGQAEFFKVVVRFSRFMLLPELARFPAQDSDLLAL